MKKKIIGLFSIILCVFAFSQVSAKEVAEADETVVQDGSYESTRFAVGNDVTSSASIDGISFLAGNTITAEGQTSYAFYAGNSISVSEKIEKDAFIAGNSIRIMKDAELLRDVYIAGNNIKINANIGRDLRVAGSTVNISGITINGNALVEAETLTLDSDTIIKGKLTYTEDTKVIGLNKANIGSIKVTDDNDISFKYEFKDLVVNFIISTIASFITMVVILHFMPALKEKLQSAELSFGNIIKMIGIGLAMLIVVPVLGFIALVTGILTPLALITLAVYFISLYLASLFVYYLIGYILIKNVFKVDNMYLALIIGILLVKLIKLIPYLGGFVGLFTLLYGLGLIFHYLKTRKEA